MTIAPLEVLGALVIGVAMGLLGGGGSILTIPVFVYAAALDPKVAVAASLPVVGFTSVAAAISHWRMGNVQVRTALFFGASAALGAFVGARLAGFLSGAMQMILLAVVMLVAAYRMSINGGEDHPALGHDVRIPYGTLIPVAFGVGVLTGIVGIGGGFLIVPTLVVICHFPIRTAVGTALMVIAINAAGGVAGYTGQVAIPWMFVAQFTAIAIVGSLVASRMVSRVAPLMLRRVFAVLLVGIGVVILVQHRHVFSGM